MKTKVFSASFAAATVFVTGFPFDWLNEFTIRDLFSTSFGETKRVQLIRLKTNSDANSALVTFEQTKSLQKLWKKIEEKTIVEAPMTTRLGIAHLLLPSSVWISLCTNTDSDARRRQGGESDRRRVVSKPRQGKGNRKTETRERRGRRRVDRRATKTRETENER